MYIEYIEKIMIKRGLKRNVVTNKLKSIYKEIEWKLIELLIVLKVKEFNISFSQLNTFLLYIGFTILNHYKLSYYDINSYFNSLSFDKYLKKI